MRKLRGLETDGICPGTHADPESPLHIRHKQQTPRNRYIELQFAKNLQIDTGNQG
jgi:hypothetical protein